MSKDLNELIKYPPNKSDHTYSVPDSIHILKENAFSDIQHLTTLYIGENVKQIEANCFSQSYRLKEINVSENNKHYCSKNGVLFNKNMTELIQYPISKDDREYDILDSVSVMNQNAFTFNILLKKVRIPLGVENIKPFAFSGCLSLEVVFVPANVCTINKEAFSYCTNLIEIHIPEHVYDISDDCFVGSPNLTIHCNKNSYAEKYAIKHSIKYKSNQ